MNSLECEKWADLSDRAALGEELTLDERHFERVHREACPVCSEEARIWQSLSSSLETERASSSPSDAALEPRPAAAPGLQPTMERKQRLWLLAAGALAATAVIALGVSGANSPTSEQKDAAVPDRAPVPVDLLLVSGEVKVGGAAASAGATLGPRDRLTSLDGQACISYSGGSSACIDTQSELRVSGDSARGDSARGDSSRERRLVLSRGKVVCELGRQPEGTVFVVETTRGTITAKGTAFSVSYRRDSRVEVRLHSGVVEVRSASGQVQELHAPSALLLGASLQRIEAPRESWASDETLLEVPSLWAEGAVAPLDVSSETPDARVSLRGISLGRAPLSMLVSRGEHELVLEAEGHTPYRETLLVQGAGRVTRSPVLLREVATNDPKGESAGTLGASSDPGALLAQAQQLRQAGQFAGAAQVYRSLLSRHPTSAQARAALLSLGELELSQLHNPAAALRSFDGYLASRGPLVQEAQYGRIRALRALGRTPEARMAAEEFVRKYKSTAQAVSLQQWLDAP